MLFFRRKTEPSQECPYDRRRSYRLNTREGLEIYLSTYYGRFQVVDISAGGVGLARCHLKKNMLVNAYLDLGDGGPHLAVTLKIRGVRGRGRVGGEFVQISEVDRERVHRFVWQNEKKRKQGRFRDNWL
ncbi:MAG: PilZ domain-containing protein [Deltaproteobacteria bacterium]|nr:PilZ domain-containing protein [Deltaproteobacteria bacterium]